MKSRNFTLKKLLCQFVGFEVTFFMSWNIKGKYVPTWNVVKLVKNYFGKVQTISKQFVTKGCFVARKKEEKEASTHLTLWLTRYLKSCVDASQQSHSAVGDFLHKLLWTNETGHFTYSEFSIYTRGKSLLESWGTTFLPDWQPPLIFVLFTWKSYEH